MVKKEEINKYASSSFSGADIKVMVTLNTYAIEKAKARQKGLANQLDEAWADANEALITGELENSKALELITKLQKELSELDKIIALGTIELGTVQTISCQAHRPKAAVRALGSTYARGYTRGPRTIAGSMIFTVINRQSLHEICLLMSNLWNTQDSDSPSTILPDQLLPLDMTFLMANEYGAVSRMAIYGVEFLNSGYTFSIEDLLLEEIVQFVARDIDPLNSIYDPQTHKESRRDVLNNNSITGRETLKSFLKLQQDIKNRRKL